MSYLPMLTTPMTFPFRTSISVGRPPSLAASHSFAVIPLKLRRFSVQPKSPNLNRKESSPSNLRSLRRKAAKWLSSESSFLITFSSTLTPEELSLFNRLKSLHSSFLGRYAYLIGRHREEIMSLEKSLGIAVPKPRKRKSAPKSDSKVRDPVLPPPTESELEEERFMAFILVSTSSPFKRSLDLADAASETGIIASFMGYEGEMIFMSRWNRYVENPRLRRAILVKHSRIAGALARTGLHRYQRQIYNFFDWLHSFRVDSYWEFMDRYLIVRFLLYDLNLFISLFVGAYLIFSGPLLIFCYHMANEPLPNLIQFYVWRRDWVMGTFWGRNLMSYLVLGYPAFAFPWLVLINVGPTPNWSLFVYGSRWHLALFSINFFLSILVSSLELIPFSTPAASMVLVLHWDLCFHILDYSLSMVEYLPYFFDSDWFGPR